MPPTLNHIVTYSGREVSRVHGVPSIKDIALSLARTPLFSGQTEEFYSVAHHCLVVAHLIPTGKVYGLVHQVAVAVVGSCPDEIKQDGQRRYEYQLRRSFYVEHGLFHPDRSSIKLVDEAAAGERGASGRVCGARMDFGPMTPLVMGTMTRVKELIAAYPPHLQFQVNSPLQKLFVTTFKAHLVSQLALQKAMKDEEDAKNEASGD